MAKRKAKKVKRKPQLNLAKYDIDKLLKKSNSFLAKEKKVKTKSLMLIIVCVLVIIVLGALFFLMPAKEVKICKTDECFITAANACESAVLEKKIATVTMRLEVKPGCVLNKRVIRMDSSEPAEVRDLFIGAEMDCNYDREEFDEDYVTQISGNLGFCSGDLVDAILAVL